MTTTMTTRSSTDPSPVMTPEGARQAAEASVGQVPDDLRELYDAAPGVGPDSYVRQMATVKEDGRPSYAVWEHQRRMQYATGVVARRERDAALEARKRTCPCCGERVETLVSTRAGVGLPNPAVCLECRPLVAAAMQSRAVLPDGRTRAAAADELAAQLWAARRDGEA